MDSDELWWSIQSDEPMEVRCYSLEYFRTGAGTVATLL